MRKIKFTLPVLVLLIAVAFAFGNMALTSTSVVLVKDNERKFSDTYFEFIGTSPSQYTDSTMWTKHSTNPNLQCPGDSVVCFAKSATLESRTQLVTYIQENDGEISGEVTIEDKRIVQ